MNIIPGDGTVAGLKDGLGDWQRTPPGPLACEDPLTLVRCDYRWGVN